MKISTLRTRISLGLSSAFLFFLVFQNCGDNPLTPTNASVIFGKVVNSETLRPVSGVLVRSFSFAGTALTDLDGLYELEVNLSDTSARLVTITFSKEGFLESFVTVNIQNGERTQIPDAEIVQQTGSFGGESEEASNVVLVGVDPSSVFVKGSGANETSNLTFEVRDANGIPVDLEHQVKVCFNIITGPGGGEFVNPDSTLTDENGRVITTLNSGTTSGTVQIVAEVIGTTIQSEPIPVSIHGWLPDQAHFTIAVNRLNFPGFNRANLRNAISVLIGDKFSNPVPPGTAVWFSSTGGVIQGSATTDGDGQATIDLISGLPQPQGVNFGTLKILNSADLETYFQETGYALITAETIDENNNHIFAEAVVLFSGIARIRELSDTTFDLSPDEFKDFLFTVDDQNNNVLAAGTSITVTTNNGSVTGDADLTLGDNLARATRYRFRLSNSKPAEIEGESTTVTISVSGPNGSAKVDIFGLMRRF